MPAGYQDQYIEQGTTFNSQISLDDSNGTSYNLTGFTIKSQARRSYYSANAAINFTVQIPDANNGFAVNVNSSNGRPNPSPLVNDNIAFTFS